MNVDSKLKKFLDSQEFLAYLIALVLSTLFIGYAPSGIAMGVFMFFALRYSIIQGIKEKVDFKLLLPVGLYLLFSLTLFWTVDKDQTTKGLQRTIVLFALPIAFHLIPKFSLKSFNIVLNIFTISNMLFGIFFLISAAFRYLTMSSLSVFTYHDLVIELELNAIYVSVTFSISLFYLLSKKAKSTYDVLLIVFFIILVLLLSSKIMLFLLFLGSIIYFFSVKVNKLKFTIAVFIGIVIIGLTSQKSLERFLFEKETKIKEVVSQNEFGPIYLWTGTSIRLLQLRILKEQIEEENIFWKGFGLFASKENIVKRHLQLKTHPGFHSYNYHNQYAQIISESGVMGLLILMSMLVVLFLDALNSKNFLFIMLSITFTFVFFTESLLWRQTGLFLFISFYCLFSRTEIANKKFKTG